MSPKCENGSSVVHRVSFRGCEKGFVINLALVLSSGPSKLSKVLSIFLFLSSLFPLFFFPFFVIRVELELGGGRGRHEKSHLNNIYIIIN